MKKLLLLIITLSLSAFACTGDCMTCHPSLKENIHQDKRHVAMLTCIKCHNPNSESMSECGADCFVCHTKDKIDKPNVREHDVIESCRQCHLKLKKEQMQFLEAAPTQSTQAPLRDFLEL